jgi:nicotinamide-nucleotide amidase
MAAGALATFGTGLAAAVTGIAGPGGGSAEKPVGLVYLDAQGPGRHERAEIRFTGDREAVRRRATVAALHLLRRVLAQSRHEDA